MSRSASRTPRIIVEIVIASAFLLGTGGAPFAWCAEPDPYGAPFEGPVHLDDSSLPDLSKTPGDAFEHVKRKDLCDEEIGQKQHTPASALCDSVFTDYRIPPEGRFQYKCSYLVPLGVGGAATQMNVWPQPVAEAAFKEKLDIELHNQICSEDISPVQAQREIVSDWVRTYRRYILLNDPPPLVIESRATEGPVSVPAAATLPPSVQAMPTQILPDGTPLQRSRHDPPRVPGDGSGQRAQSANPAPIQRLAATMPQRPIGVPPQRRTMPAPHRAVNFVPRGMAARLRDGRRY